jgi:hypothetical protein
MRVAAGDNDADFDFRLEALTAEDLRDLAAGLVPATLRAQALSLLDYEDSLRRNAEKPLRSSGGRGRGRS